MTRQNDLETEARTTRRHSNCIRALEFELEGAVQATGALLLGFSVKIGAEDYLVTLRVIEEDVHYYGFISGHSLPAAIVNCVTAVRRDSVKWRVDSFRKP